MIVSDTNEVFLDFVVAIRHTNVGRFEVSTVPKVSRTHAH